MGNEYPYVQRMSHGPFEAYWGLSHPASCCCHLGQRHAPYPRPPCTSPAARRSSLACPPGPHILQDGTAELRQGDFARTGHPPDQEFLRMKRAFACGSSEAGPLASPWSTAGVGVSGRPHDRPLDALCSVHWSPQGSWPFRLRSSCSSSQSKRFLNSSVRVLPSSGLAMT